MIIFMKYNDVQEINGGSKKLFSFENNETSTHTEYMDMDMDKFEILSCENAQYILRYFDMH